MLWDAGEDLRRRAAGRRLCRLRRHHCPGEPTDRLVRRVLPMRRGARSTEAWLEAGMTSRQATRRRLAAHSAEASNQLAHRPCRSRPTSSAAEARRIHRAPPSADRQRWQGAGKTYDGPRRRASKSFALGTASRQAGQHRSSIRRAGAADQTRPVSAQPAGLQSTCWTDAPCAAPWSSSFRGLRSMAVRRGRCARHQRGSPCCVVHRARATAARAQPDRANSFWLQRNLRGAVSMVVLNDSYHVVTMDRQRQIVADRTVAFMESVVARAAMRGATATTAVECAVGAVRPSPRLRGVGAGAAVPASCNAAPTQRAASEQEGCWSSLHRIVIVGGGRRRAGACHAPRQQARPAPQGRRSR